MSTVLDIEQQITAVLKTVAQKLDLCRYSFNLNINAQKGDGFLGEFYKASILDEENNTQIYLALKKAPANQKRREENNIEKVYKNEIRFYSVVYPALKKFEEESGVLKPFAAIPEYFVSVEKIGEEIIVFKDITILGFELREKNLLLDDAHARLIFKTYGHYHAISFCLKKRKPELFEELIKPFYDYFEYMANKKGFDVLLNKLAKKAYDALDQEKEVNVREKFRKYLDLAGDLFAESVKYEGEHYGILHGDCWSNNMMFKYQDESGLKVEAVNLLDFQLVRAGTPVYDLSYFFYVGGSKELFDKLEEYLDVYYNSFSKWAKELGCDPKELLPREVLTQDWKRYSKFGMLMAFLLTKIKLISKENSIEMTERDYDQDELNQEKEVDDFINMGHKEDNILFSQRVRDIVVHMYEIDAL